MLCFCGSSSWPAGGNLSTGEPRVVRSRWSAFAPLLNWAGVSLHPRSLHYTPTFGRRVHTLPGPDPHPPGHVSLYIGTALNYRNASLLDMVQQKWAFNFVSTVKQPLLFSPLQEIRPKPQLSRSRKKITSLNSNLKF